MRAQVEERFREFYETWVYQLEQYSHHLLSIDVTKPSTSASEQELQALVSKLTAHHKEYYTVKWAAPREDVLVFFSQSWLSPLERAHFWFTGWKPSIAFRLIDSLRNTQSCLTELTKPEIRMPEELQGKVPIEEQKVEREMERHQVGMADRRMVELAKAISRVDGGSAREDLAAAGRLDGLVELASEGLTAGLERVMKAADCARLKTLKGILEILSPAQCVVFLAGVSVLQVQLRRWGKQRE